MWLGSVVAGELILWHTQDPDARVRDRAFHCLLSWTTVPPVDSAFTELHASLRADRIGWIQSNLESVYSAACHGLLDVEEMVSLRKNFEWVTLFTISSIPRGSGVDS